MPKSSKGAVNPLTIVVVLAVVAIGGYFLAQKGGISIPSTSTLTQRATEKDFEFIEDTTLRKHFVVQANQSVYRSKMVGTGSGLTIVNEVQMRGGALSTKEIQSDGAKEIKHMIAIGDTIYLKDYSDNKWWKQTIKYEEMKDDETEAPEEPKDFKEEYSQPNITYKSLGQEACGNLNCFKYEMYDPENPDLKRVFWFDDKDLLLRKERSGFGEFIGVLEYSYDGINIQDPSPTKDVPEGRSIYEYSSAGYNTSAPLEPPIDYQIPEAPVIDSETDYQETD